MKKTSLFAFVLSALAIAACFATKFEIKIVEKTAAACNRPSCG